ncbi:MAG: aminopeptidase N [Bdellovibrionales bacterium]|nr:aminopeptidase N [Bdellovibrionales bacterium]
MSDNPQTIYLKDYKPPSFLIPNIELNFDLHEEETIVTATMHLKRNPLAEHVDELFLNGNNLELLELEIDGESVKPGHYQVSAKGLTLTNLSSDMMLTTKVRIQPQNNKAFSGLYKTKTVFCTQMEAQGFRNTTYFLDRPDVLSIYRTRIVADKNKCPVLLSNGNFIEQTDLADGRHQAVWEDPFPKPCYLFALVAGDLDWIEDSYQTISKRKVDLRIYVDKGKKERARYAMDCLKQSMKWDEDTYRLEYDLDIYNIVAVDDFNMGAMENKGLNIFNSKYVLADSDSATDEEFQGIQRVIGHEYFHNWTGNRVTCRDWFQLSLKEGLTVFRDQEFSSDMNSRPVKRIEDVAQLRSRQFPEDAGPMAHPVRPASYIAIDNFYTVTVYEKGAEVIRMLHTLLGHEMFKKGVAKYFELFDGQAVTTDDWVHAMEVVSGRDLSQFKLWYDQAGTPEISVHSSYDENKKTLTLEFTQKTTDPTTGKDNKAYLIPIKMGLLSEKGHSLEFVEKGRKKSSTVLELHQSTQSFELSEIYEKPVPSLLREFSAPVKLNFEQTDNDLYLMMTRDTDSFNRWEAGQKLFLKTLLTNYRRASEGENLEFPQALLDAFGQSVELGLEDPALTACLLKKPSMQYFAQFLEEIDPSLVDKTYTHFTHSIGHALHETLMNQYSALAQKTLGNSSKDIALRSFKNTLLSYLYRHDEEAGAPFFLEQFEKSSNMTDSLAALTRLSHASTPQAQKAMDVFYAKWKQDSLVINKWLTVHAMSQGEDTFEQIKKVCKDPAFDSTNPNKVFALFYYFAQFNWPKFHRLQGDSYAWLADQILDIDSRNPMLASRLASCFNNWKTLAEPYRKKIEPELRRIHSASPSDNVFEIIDRALK